MKKFFDTFLLAIKGSEKEFTTGNINRAIFLLAIPMILEMLMESLFAVVDAFFVAKISMQAVATVGLTETVITLVYSLAIGISMAATAMVARRIGEKDPEAAAKAAGQSILLSIGIAFIIALIGFFFAEDILRLMGGDPELIASGVGYTRIALCSNVVIMLLFLLNGIFRGAGDASIAMWSLWISNGLNIILDPLFIFGIGPFPELGVTGAAVATTIGRGTGVLFQLFILFNGRSLIRLAWKHLKPDWLLLKRQIDIAAGGTGQYLIGSASWIFLMRIIAAFGEDAVAGYTIAIRLLIFTILPSWGMANAAATLVGQNLGANQADRATTSVWRTAHFNMLFLISVALIYFFAAEPLINIFTTEPVAVTSGVMSLQIICAGYPAFAYGMVISQAFNGAGDTRTPTIINFICFWLLEIPLAYTLAFQLNMGEPGPYWAIAISESMLAVIAVYWFRKGYWKTTVV